MLSLVTGVGVLTRIVGVFSAHIAIADVAAVRVTLRAWRTLHADHDVRVGVVPQTELVGGVNAQTHWVVCEDEDVVDPALSLLLAEPGDAGGGHLLLLGFLRTADLRFLPTVQFAVVGKFERTENLRFVLTGDEDCAVLSRGDVPLQALEDEQVLACLTLGLDLFMGVEHTWVGMHEVGVLRKHHPVAAEVLGGIQLILNPVLCVVAPLGVDVVIAD